MKTITNRLILLCTLWLTFVPLNETKAGVKGADVSWVTQMEAAGYIWYNASGVQQDLFTILNGLGINAIRLRVWVNPSNGWCGKTDVVNKAVRAKNAGMSVMIDFHYSDTWADPGSQTKPSAWSSHGISQLYTDVWEHTVEVCNALKTAGVTPAWVQIGNETNNGMLWPEGKASTYMSQFAGLITSGYNGVKSVFSSAVVIVHLSNGYDNSLFRWLFDGLTTYGAKYDAIGMSLYPSTSNWSTLNTQCLTNMNDMKSRYGKSTMICEVGMAADAPATCALFLKDIRAKNTSAGGLGVFYWEPEAYSWQGYGLGVWDYSTKRPTAALIDGLKSATIESNTTTVTTSGVNIYPNPLDGEDLKIELNDLSGATAIKLLNVNGQQIREQVVVDQPLVTLDKSYLVPGIYFVQIDNVQKKVIKTLIVK